MLIVAHHVVLDPAAFWKAAAEAPLPPHLKLHHVLPSRDGSTGVCLWEAESAESVRDFVEPALGTISRNEYFPVHDHNAQVLSLAGMVAPDALGAWRQSSAVIRPVLDTDVESNLPSPV